MSDLQILKAKCPNCHMAIQVKTRSLEKVVACPRCQAAVKATAASDASQTEESPEANQRPAVARSRSASSFRVVAGIGVVALLIGAGVFFATQPGNSWLPANLNGQGPVVQQPAQQPAQPPLQDGTQAATAQPQQAPRNPQQPNNVGPTAAAAGREPAGQRPATSPFKSIVVEGAGLTIEDARKDAFRNAVRQAAGTLIDAETLVQNDQVVKDQILAYSNALVKSYRDVGQPKLDGGLYRLTIIAAVEQLGLEQKVARARESFQKVDAEGLYARFQKELGDEKAQKLTDAERREAARAMMEKLLEGFPLNCLEATLDGEPKVAKREGDKITFAVRILLKPNVKAFDEFAGRLTARLEKMARDKDEFGLKAEPKQYEGGDVFGFSQEWGGLMPRRFEDTGAGTRCRSRGTVVVAVNTSRSKANDRTLWKYYELDDSVFAPLYGVACCVLTVKLDWLNKEGKLQGTERLRAVVDVAGGPAAANFVIPADDGYLPGQVHAYLPGAVRGFAKELYDARVAQLAEQGGVGGRLFLLSPYFQKSGYGMYVTQALITSEVTLSVEDVRELKGFRCDLRFEDPVYRELPPRVKAEK